MAEAAELAPEQGRARLRFWGVRGSTPTPQAENLGFGGNTPCIEMRTSDNDVLLFDAGSGIRAAGLNLLREAAGQPVRASLFLSHFHWDHIQGLPFFVPIYAPRNEISFFTGLAGCDLRETLAGQMSKPYFPVDFNLIAGHREFHLLGPGQTRRAGSALVTPFPLNHPQGASGYRIQIGKTVVCIVTDYEHGHTELDSILKQNVEGADILICDAQYTPEEYESRRGWGHSTWENAAAVALEAGARRLLLFHHDPAHDDEFLRRIVAQTRALFPNTEAAREGMVIEFEEPRDDAAQDGDEAA